jgi:spermidine synthase
MLGKPIILEKHDRSHGSFFRVDDILFEGRSEFQDILVFDTPDHGRVLFIDDQIMFTETSQAPYNEAMAYLPMQLHAAPRRVLIIGGGDGCVLRAVLRDPEVEQVVLAELDPMVIDVTRTYFPDFGSTFDDPRVQVRIGDGAAWVRETDERFDVCIIDSTDPYLDADPESVATPLAQDDFYEDLKGLLGPHGVGSQILGHHYFYRRIMRLLVARLKAHWHGFGLALVPVPFYISGSWSLGVFSQSPLDVSRPRRCGARDLEWYNEEVHSAAFAHPNDVRAFLAEIDANA